MAGHDFLSNLRKNFPYNPTGDQKDLMIAINGFFGDPDPKKSFILKGYAGTGKTTFIQALVKTYERYEYNIVLLAPTGRAAKVMNDYTGKSAGTIHRRIYNMDLGKTGTFRFKAAKNTSQKTLFIVDEASMIAAGEDKSLFKGRSLLTDLIRYVYSGTGCHLIFIGDTAQLPPVGEEGSPALDISYLENKFKLKIHHAELRDVVRQALESGILLHATSLRNRIIAGSGDLVLESGKYPDIERINGNSLLNSLVDAYRQYDSENTLVICRSNKQANRYNDFIRKNIFNYTEGLETGDRLMVVKNNYYWLNDGSSTAFIANGDFIRIKRLLSTEQKYGFSFATAEIDFPDYPLQHKTEVKLLLDTISSETPALSPEQSKLLFENISIKYKKLKKTSERIRAVYDDPYYNALLVKSGYAITCHKAQGGQWQSVFVDSGFVNESGPSPELLRWLYTAFTRASQKLYLVNMHERFFRNNISDRE
jgi:exodeoxyribonuclease-5